jgi:hypothetical protein
MDRARRLITAFTAGIALMIAAATIATAPPLIRLAGLTAHPATPGRWRLS